jgi:branched-chain amino acid transport system permease protein
VVKTVVSSYVDRWNTLLGVIFLAVIVFMPEGLVPGLARLRRRFGR